MILSFVQTKGGTGKSTAALTVATSKAFARAFETVALVELDTQGTLATWYKARLEMNPSPKARVSFVQLLETSPAVVGRELTRLAREYSALVLDSPGESAGAFMTRLCLEVADVAVIPLRTTGPDEAAFLAHMAPLVAGNDAAVVLPTFTHPRTGIERIVEYVEAVTGLPCLRAALPARSVYEHFGREGQTLSEYQDAVKANTRTHAQAATATADVEQIAKRILKRHGPT